MPKNLGWLFGTLLKACLFRKHITPPPISATNVREDFSLQPLAWSEPASTHFHARLDCSHVNTACPSNGFPGPSGSPNQSFELLVALLGSAERSCFLLWEIVLRPCLCRTYLSWLEPRPRCPICPVLRHFFQMILSCPRSCTHSKNVFDDSPSPRTFTFTLRASWLPSSGHS